MTLDEIVAQGKSLSYDDLLAVSLAFNKEVEQRRDREGTDAWNKVCNAIDNYVGNYGYFTIFVNGEEFYLHRGGYVFGEIGELSIVE